MLYADYAKLVHETDKAMYQAKDAGKNTVVIARYSGRMGH